MTRNPAPLGYEGTSDNSISSSLSRYFLKISRHMYFFRKKTGHFFQFQLKPFPNIRKWLSFRLSDHLHTNYSVDGSEYCVLLIF